MNLTLGHILVACLIVICTTILAASGHMSSDNTQTLFVATLTSLFGHGVGYAAGRESVSAPGK